MIDSFVVSRLSALITYLVDCSLWKSLPFVGGLLGDRGCAGIISFDFPILTFLKLFHCRNDNTSFVATKVTRWIFTLHIANLVCSEPGSWGVSCAQ